MTTIQSAFGGNVKRLKGALHVHTTRSDGRGSPEDVLRLYASRGFDFVALTDHNIYNTENFAPDTNLLIIPGVERNFDIPRSAGSLGHTFHTVALGRSPERGNKYVHNQRFEFRGPVENQHELQPYLDEIHEAGNVTFLCHPEWSGTPAREFDRMKGHFGMEIWNSGCALEDDMDTNAACWDEMLGLGSRWYGVAVDDGHEMYQHANGWVMVNAERTVDGVVDALEAGAFYSSCGPEIRDFRVEDGVAVIECSPCLSAGFTFTRRPSRLTWDRENAAVARAEFRVPEGHKYVRGVVKDARGRRAWTNPIFL
ncbi:MAG: CehA/McbA family metallohydrolase [Oscillospiraceae bacterium]|jgi:hypothetical protein|nr:CehA/McbA family metallohydrolase [Oscillospiraceae bacterium]